MKTRALVATLVLLSLGSTDLKAELNVEIKVGTAIEKMTPQGVNKRFSSKVPQLVGWTRVKGATQPTDIVHEWVHEGEVVSVVPLKIRSSYFRTWSRKKLRGQSGHWMLRVKDEQGNVVARKSFKVK